ncbi:hypothetical protein [Bradyrhizobium sp. 150]|uniref:hypothetical protein n=1 Tax=Bradyrhizobium sp. 150 TaxID=2782625 RepID=UPI001FFAB820|nr:hypothetical protein [Bradyrhizobium sp. 150]MCK1676770.1 hypothetical protein [Bradyrhizobium sp. 150]
MAAAMSALSNAPGGVVMDRYRPFSNQLAETAWRAANLLNRRKYATIADARALFKEILRSGSD